MAAEDRRRAVLAECARLGITVRRLGAVWHLFGPQTDIVTTDLCFVSVGELRMPVPTR